MRLPRSPVLIGALIGTLTGLLLPAAARAAPDSHLSAPKAAAPAAEPAGFGRLAGHRAEYQLRLKPGRNPGAIAASGRMVFTFTPSCAGYATTQRIVIDITGPDGTASRLVSDYATLEALDGRWLRFTSRQSTGNQAPDVVSGEAQAGPAGGSVTYSAPPGRRRALPPGTLLPGAHIKAMLAAAEAGQHFFAAPLFDGTSAEGAEDSFVTLGRMRPAQPRGRALIDGQASVPVHISFFPQRPGQGDQTPDFALAARFFANGVASEMELDFGDFTVSGELQQLTPRPAPHC